MKNMIILLHAAGSSCDTIVVAAKGTDVIIMSLCYLDKMQCKTHAVDYANTEGAKDLYQFKKSIYYKLSSEVLASLHAARHDVVVYPCPYSTINVKYFYR